AATRFSRATDWYLDHDQWANRCVEASDFRSGSRGHGPGWRYPCRMVRREAGRHAHASTGTDNCTPFAAAIASLTAGGNVTLLAGNGTLLGYRTTCEWDITTTGTGIVGVALDQNYG